MAMPTSLLISGSLYTLDRIRLSGLTPMGADDVAATVVPEGPHEHGAAAGASQKEVPA
jgi:hypothetical protein